MARGGDGLLIAMVSSRAAGDVAHPRKMSTVRLLRMSEALARLGHRVDVIGGTASRIEARGPRLRVVPRARARWHDYDVVKVSYQRGFEELMESGADGHPFVICRLGAVAGADDGVPGVAFSGAEREALHRSQRRIDAAARAVVVLTEPDRRTWEAGHALRSVLLVPTGVDALLPPPGADPWAGLRRPGERIAVYVGNLRGERREHRVDGTTYRYATQEHVNDLWQRRLGALGRRLRAARVRLCVVGPGRTDRLDPDAVTCLGPVDHGRAWDLQRFADAGVALAQGAVQNHECSKIYAYLRAGLPVVSEEPVPNNHLVHQTGLGLVAPHGDDDLMAEMIADAAHRAWDRAGAMEHMVRHHAWDRRAHALDALLRGRDDGRRVGSGDRPGREREASGRRAGGQARDAEACGPGAAGG